MDRSKWEYKKLGDISFYPRKRLEKEFLSVSNYVGVENLLKDKKGRIDAEDLPANNTSTIEYMPNDILIGNIRPYLRKIWLADKKGGASGDVIVVRINEDYREILYPNYLYLVLSDNSFFNYDMAHSKGAKMPRGDKDAVLKYTIPIPSYEDQQRIVAELDCLNEMIAVKQEQLKEFDKLAQSIFYDMFGEGSWKISKIKDIATVKIGPFGSALHQSDYISGGTPLVNPVHMVNGAIIADNDFTVSSDKISELKPYLLKTNDVVFGRRGDIGRCALVTEKESGYLCGTGSMYVRFNIDIDPVYALKILSSEETRKYLLDNAKGATMLNINGGIVENIGIPLPPLSLQQKFAEKISAIEAQKELVKQSIAETQALLDYTMDYYFND